MLRIHSRLYLKSNVNNTTLSVVLLHEKPAIPGNHDSVMSPVPARSVRKIRTVQLIVQYRMVLEICELKNIGSLRKVRTRCSPENLVHLITPDGGPNAPPTLYTGCVQDLCFEHLTLHDVQIDPYVHERNHTIHNVRKVMEK